MRMKNLNAGGRIVLSQKEDIMNEKIVMENIVKGVELAQVIFQDFKIEYEEFMNFYIFKVEFLEKKIEATIKKKEIENFDHEIIYSIICELMLKMLN